MTRRRLGWAAARQMAASPSLAAALAALAETPYGHDVRPGQTLAQAQRAVVDTVVWNLRVLAGWVPREGVVILRVLLSALEISNVEDHLHRLAGGEAPPPYRLGALATAWPRLAATDSPEAVRAVLASSWWGDPGDGVADDIGVTMRSTWASQVMAVVPAASAWAAGAVALLVARTLTLTHGTLPARSRLGLSRVIGPAALSAATVPELSSALPAAAAWALADVTDPSDLWKAEARWWGRVERDALHLVRRVFAGPEALVATAALLSVDAWRVRGALELAARGGSPLEVFDALG